VCCLRAEGETIIITTDMSKPCDNFYLPVKEPRFPQLVQPGDIVFVGQYLFTGSETTSVYMEVLSTSGEEVVCRCNNNAHLSGELLILQIVGKEVRGCPARRRCSRPTPTYGVCG
jgi:pyruvate kinase